MLFGDAVQFALSFRFGPFLLFFHALGNTNLDRALAYTEVTYFEIIRVVSNRDRIPAIDLFIT